MKYIRDQALQHLEIRKSVKKTNQEDQNQGENEAVVFNKCSERPISGLILLKNNKQLPSCSNEDPKIKNINLNQKRNCKKAQNFINKQCSDSIPHSSSTQKEVIPKHSSLFPRNISLYSFEKQSILAYRLKLNDISYIKYFTYYLTCNKKYIRYIHKQIEIASQILSIGTICKLSMATFSDPSEFECSDSFLNQ